MAGPINKIIDAPEDAPEPETPLDHLFFVRPEMTLEQAEENLRCIVEALEALNREDAGDQPESEEEEERVEEI